MLWLLLACGSPPPDHHAHGDHAGHGDHGHHPKVEHAHHDFDDPEKWSAIFDDPKRDAWQKPDLVVSGLDLEAGMVVADIGAGTGYFNRHLAKAVGAEGRVIAVDIGPKLVEHMKARAVEENTPQVEARLTKPDASGLKPVEADRVVLVDVYHHLQDRKAYFRGLLSAMKPGGMLAIVDLTKEAPFGPPVDERLTPDQVQTELTAAGWTFHDAVDGLPHQYMLRFTAASEAPADEAPPVE